MRDDMPTNTMDQPVLTGRITRSQKVMTERRKLLGRKRHTFQVSATRRKSLIAVKGSYSVNITASRHNRILNDVKQVKLLLSTIVKKAEGDRWLAAPNMMLGNCCPLDAIKRGRTQQVREILARLAEGIYV